MGRKIGGQRGNRSMLRKVGAVLAALIFAVVIIAVLYGVSVMNQASR